MQIDEGSFRHRISDVTRGWLIGGQIVHLTKKYIFLLLRSPPRISVSGLL